MPLSSSWTAICQDWLVKALESGYAGLTLQETGFEDAAFSRPECCEDGAHELSESMPQLDINQHADGD